MNSVKRSLLNLNLLPTDVIFQGGLPLWDSLDEGMEKDMVHKFQLASMSFIIIKHSYLAIKDHMEFMKISQPYIFIILADSNIY